MSSSEPRRRNDGRDPCPWRILDDMGAAFAMGSIGGAVWHMFKGAKDSPKGQRMPGALLAMRTRAPQLGGAFAVWGGVFSTTDCSLMYIRGVDDFINPIASGFITGGVLAARAGPSMAFRSAMVGGVFLALIEGVNVFLMRALEKKVQATAPAMAGGPPPPPPPPSSLSKPKPMEKTFSDSHHDAE